MSTVIVVGSINVDLSIKVERLPSPGETVIGGTFAQTPGGKGGNQAAAAARLGAQTWMVGMVGDDTLGKSALSDLREGGVDVSTVQTSPDPTGVASILVDRQGENLIAVASGANDRLTPEGVGRALESLPVRGAAVLGVLEIPQDAVLAAARAAEALGGVFVLNPAPAPAKPLDPELVAACDVITPNEHEARVLGSPESLLEQGAKAVVVTRGAQGAEVWTAGASVVRRPAFPVDAVDTTGAGDAFSAALAWALAEGRRLEEAVTLAAATGALSTRAWGARAGLPTRVEVEELARS